MLNRQIEETIINRIEMHQKVSQLIDSRPSGFSQLIVILTLMGYGPLELKKTLSVSKQAIQYHLNQARKDAARL